MRVGRIHTCHIRRRNRTRLQIRRVWRLTVRTPALSDCPGFKEILSTLPARMTKSKHNHNSSHKIGGYLDILSRRTRIHYLYQRRTHDLRQQV